MKIHRTMAVVAIATAVLTTSLSPVVQPAWAQDGGKSAEQQLEELEAVAQETLERLMTALEGMLQAVPQYEIPEITEDGDIIIRRARPGDEPGDKPKDGTLGDDDMDET